MCDVCDVLRIPKRPRLYPRIHWAIWRCGRCLVAFRVCVSVRTACTVFLIFNGACRVGTPAMSRSATLNSVELASGSPNDVPSPCPATPKPSQVVKRELLFSAPKTLDQNKKAKPSSKAVEPEKASRAVAPEKASEKVLAPERSGKVPPPPTHPRAFGAATFSKVPPPPMHPRALATSLPTAAKSTCPEVPVGVLRSPPPPPTPPVVFHGSSCGSSCPAQDQANANPSSCAQSAQPSAL